MTKITKEFPHNEDVLEEEILVKLIQEKSDQCADKLTNESELKAHRATTHDGHLHQLKHCNFIAKNKGGLTRHVNVKHDRTEIEPFKVTPRVCDQFSCDNCGDKSNIKLLLCIHSLRDNCTESCACTNCGWQVGDEFY